MRYIKIFEDFGQDPELKDLILTVVETPEKIAHKFGFQIWGCENIDEESLDDLNYRLSAMDTDLEAFLLGPHYDNGVMAQYRFIICQKGWVDLIPLDKYGEETANIFRKNPSARFFLSLFDLESSVSESTDNSRRKVSVNLDFVPKPIIRPQSAAKIRTKGTYTENYVPKELAKMGYATPWTYFDQTYVTHHDFWIFDYTASFGINEFQQILGKKLFSEYLDSKGEKYKIA
jgi:hypothetical protein